MTTAPGAHDVDTIVTPTIRFHSGSVQILNPGFPIPGVMADILTLDPIGVLAAHRHDHNSSLLMCIGGSGIVAVNGHPHPLQPGTAVFIPSGSVHHVSAGVEGMKCLSINTGIAPPDRRPDLHFTADGIPDFAEDCSRAAAEFSSTLQSNDADDLVFRFSI